nr:MAG TPA: ASCH domain protein [Caudoviricetes sp.]
MSIIRFVTLSWEQCKDVYGRVTKMRIRPILLNGDMVRAILDGRKTCTRRVIKPQLEECPNCKHVHNEYIYDKMAENVYCARCGYPLVPERRVPYQPGDILYVRETWCGWYLPLVGMHYCYRATEPDGNKRPTSPEYDCDVEKISWHPSIHMPKEAARIWLKVTDVRVERLQSITEEGAIREGAEGEKCHHTNAGAFGCIDCMNTGWIEPPQVEFMQIWDSTIKKSDLDRYGWDANPYVFVIQFVKSDRPEESEK